MKGARKRRTCWNTAKLFYFRFHRDECTDLGVIRDHSFSKWDSLPNLCPRHRKKTTLSIQITRQHVRDHHAYPTHGPARPVYRHQQFPLGANLFPTDVFDVLIADQRAGTSLTFAEAKKTTQALFEHRAGVRYAKSYIRTFPYRSNGTQYRFV
jgi:hypothetical protein